MKKSNQILDGFDFLFCDFFLFKKTIFNRNFNRKPFKLFEF